MVGWLDGSYIVWLVVRLYGWWAGALVGWLVGGLLGSLVVWLVVWLDGCWVGGLIGW